MWLSNNMLRHKNATHVTYVLFYIWPHNTKHGTLAALRISTNQKKNSILFTVNCHTCHPLYLTKCRFVNNFKLRFILFSFQIKYNFHENCPSEIVNLHNLQMLAVKRLGKAVRWNCLVSKKKIYGQKKYMTRTG